MVYGTYLSFCCMFLSICLVVSDSDKKDVPAEPGQTVILPCKAPRNTPVTAAEWIRLNGPTVCLYRGNKDGQCERDDQSQFQGRVQLNKDWMKNGNVSLILKNVTINDAGTYECHVKRTESTRQKRAGYLNAELIDTIDLKVKNSGGGAGHKDGGDKDGNIGRKVVPSVVGVLLLVAVGYLIYRKRIKKLNSDQHPADERVKEPLKNGVELGSLRKEEA